MAWFLPGAQEPSKGGFEIGVLVKVCASLGCGALSADCTAGSNTLGVLCVLARDAGFRWPDSRESIRRFVPRIA